MRPDSPGPAVLVDVRRSDHAAEPERDDDEGEPAEGRGLPVCGAPATHAGREVVPVLSEWCGT